MTPRPARRRRRASSRRAARPKIAGSTRELGHDGVRLAAARWSSTTRDLSPQRGADLLDPGRADRATRRRTGPPRADATRAAGDGRSRAGERAVQRRGYAPDEGRSLA